jgi:hypothetical protein
MNELMKDGLAAVAWMGVLGLVIIQRDFDNTLYVNDRLGFQIACLVAFNMMAFHTLELLKGPRLT